MLVEVVAVLVEEGALKVEEVAEKVEEAIAESEETGEPLPENIQKLMVQNRFAKIYRKYSFQCDWTYKMEKVYRLQ